MADLVEYPQEEKNNVRYKYWYKIYIYILDEIVNYNMSPKESFAKPFPNQDEIYSLRNNMLDERNPKID